MSVLLWSAVGYLAGSLPFSVWLGRLFLGTDIRKFGDGNPGGTNVLRAGGKILGVLVIVLDGLKGLLPVVLARQISGLDGWALLPVALAPVVGHAFSLFLGMRGGKAVAVTFGIWAGLTGWPTLFVLGGLLLAATRAPQRDAWAVMAMLLGLLVYLLIRGPGPALLAAWLGNSAVLAWKHRAELVQ